MVAARRISIGLSYGRWWFSTPNGTTTPAPRLHSICQLRQGRKAAATRRAYGTDFCLFLCMVRRQECIGAAGQRGDGRSLLGRSDRPRNKSLDPGPPVGCYSHKLANLQTPTDAEAVKATLRGIRRTLGAAKLKKAPAIAERIKAMVRTCPETTAAPAILLNLLRSTNPTLKEAFKALTEQDAGKSQL